MTSYTTCVLSHTCVTTLSTVLTQYDQDIREALAKNLLVQEIFKALQASDKHHKTVPLGEYKIENELLLVNNLVYVPDSFELYFRILKTYYDHPPARHPGREATYEHVSRDY